MANVNKDQNEKCTDDKIKIQKKCDIDNVKVVLTDFQENFLK